MATSSQLVGRGIGVNPLGVGFRLCSGKVVVDEGAFRQLTARCLYVVSDV